MSRVYTIDWKEFEKTLLFTGCLRVELHRRFYRIDDTVSCLDFHGETSPAGIKP